MACTSGCALVLQKEIEFWQLDEFLMEPCCAIKYFPEIDLCMGEKDGEEASRQRELEAAAEEDFGNTFVGSCRSYLWNLLEYPWTSRAAQAFAILSVLMVIVSTCTFLLSTAVGESGHPAFAVAIEAIDGLVILFFTLEYLARLICSPKKIKFLKGLLNFVDLMALVPFYMSLLLEGLEDYQVIGRAGKIIRLVKVMKILRIYKLFRPFFLQHTPQHL